MIDDPIVEEVRKHRQENAAKFGYDVRAIAEDARKREKTSGHRIVNLQEIDKRPKPARKPRKPAHLRPDCERGPTLR
jgi:hypothetical protein